MKIKKSTVCVECRRGERSYVLSLYLKKQTNCIPLCHHSAQQHLPGSFPTYQDKETEIIKKLYEFLNETSHLYLGV